MKGGKRTTPDGRVINYADSQPDAATGSPELALGALQPFIDACLAALPEQPLSGDKRLGLFVFFLGAADRMWQRYGLDDRRFPHFAAHLLQAHGVSPSAAATIAHDLPQLREVETAHAILIEGANLFEEWLDGHDTDTVLRLTEVIAQWDDLGLPLRDRR